MVPVDTYAQLLIHIPITYLPGFIITNSFNWTLGLLLLECYVHSITILISPLMYTLSYLIAGKFGSILIWQLANSQR